jgi:endo-1,4-beta-xylanase
VELLYNDYSMTGQAKRNAVVAMIKDLKGKNIRIDGVGMQGHWGIIQPSINYIEASIIAYASAGVKVHITELDIDVLPRKPGMYGADVSQRMSADPSSDPYVNGLPEEKQQQLAKRYEEIFRLFLKHRDKIERVTFWGATDRYSWLNNWPIHGRTSHPLLFDRNGNPKPAFHSVIKVASEK